MYLGSDLIWTADQETGDLSQWSAPNGIGGVSPVNASVEVTTEQAHTGLYSIKLTNVTSATALTGDPNAPGGEGVYREQEFPTEAYYSAWYYLPQYYQTITSWAILKFKSPLSGSVGDGGIIGEFSELIDLRLESQPSQTMTVVLFDHRPQYLRSPLPDPPPIVPIGQWFQIEAFYRNIGDPTGHLTVWLNGVQIYDVTRPMYSRPGVYFMPCNLANVLSPATGTLYVDDVAVSWTRIGPWGLLTVPE